MLEIFFKKIEVKPFNYSFLAL